MARARCERRRPDNLPAVAVIGIAVLIGVFCYFDRGFYRDA